MEANGAREGAFCHACVTLTCYDKCESSTAICRGAMTDAEQVFRMDLFNFQSEERMKPFSQHYNQPLRAGMFLFFLLAALLLLVLQAPSAQAAATWGSAWGYASTWGANEANFAVTSNGNAYVVFSDINGSSVPGHNNKAMVERCITGGGCGYLGGVNTGFTSAQAGFVSVALAPGGLGTPYVAYQLNTGATFYAQVQYFDGSSWVPLGGNASTTEAAFVDVALDSSNNPYIVYTNQTSGSTHKATVRHWNGSAWSTVGSADFSAGAAWQNQIVVDASNTPYVVYRDGTVTFGKATVKKYNGSSWVNVGSAGFSAGDIALPSIALDQSGTPYVAYADLTQCVSTDHCRMTVKKFDGSGWVDVGSAGFSDYVDIAKSYYNTGMAINNNGNIFVSFVDWEAGDHVTVMEWDGTKWFALGGVGASASVFPASTFGFTDAKVELDGTGTPYVMMIDAGADSYLVHMMKFTGGTLAGWTAVGSKGFKSNAPKPDIAFGKNSNIPYVIMQDGTNGNRPLVEYNDGSGWSPLGNLSGLFTNNVDYPTIAVDSSGIPYVAFEDYDNSQKLTVMQWSNPNWTYVGGSPGISAGAAFYVKLALDKNDVPYVAYADLGTTTGNVKKFSSGSWSDVGPVFFSGGLSAVSLALDSNNIPYVAYTEQGSGKASVKKYNSGANTWDLVGPQYLTGDQARNVVLALDGSDTPYIAFQDYTQGSSGNNPISVMKLNSGNWAYVGSAGISANAPSFMDMTPDNNGNPLVFFGDKNPNASNNNYASVLKFDGANWNFLGGQFFSDGSAAGGHITLDNNGAPHVVYQDFAHSSGATVEKHSQTTAVNVSGLRKGTVSDKQVQLKWKTQTESQIAGFDVYRKLGEGQFKQVNAKFIPAKFSGSPEGASYAFNDKKIKSHKVYHYKLRVTYLDGHMDWTPEIKVKTP